MAQDTNRPITRVAVGFDWLGPNLAVVHEEPGAPPETGRTISHSGETFLVPSQWLGRLATNSDKILARGGGLDLDFYEQLLDDDVAFSNFQQRRLAVISREWEVAPGDDEDARSVEASDHLRAQLKRISFDRICDRMLFGVWFGYAVGEAVYDMGPDLKIRLADVVVPDRKFFGFTTEGELRFRYGGSLQSLALPPNKFWTIRTGASHDFAFYGLGLAHWCYWPVWFKRNIIKFWALYLEKLGYPTVVGEALNGWSDVEKLDHLRAMTAIGRDRAVQLPEGALEKVELMEASRSGAGTSSYLEFTTEQNEALMRIILGQPGSSKATASGLGSGQAEAHADVKAEIVKADSDLLCESFNNTIAKWLTAWNFGEEVAPPRVYRKLDDEEDVNTVAKRDVDLDGIGIRRTKDSVEDVYGPGYELVERPTPAEEAAAKAAALAKPLAPGAAANDDEREEQRAAFAARDVAPLYVYRQLTNARDVIAWARAQGIPNIENADELHVTVLWSRTPVDWFELSDGHEYDEKVRVTPGGARKVERLGEEGAIVLRFGSDTLEWQHRRKIERGASHDYPEYLPHVTIGFDAEGDFDLENVEPYNGALEFGPEIFEPLKVRTPPTGIRPVTFSAEDEDAIERLASSLAQLEGEHMQEFAAGLRKALDGAPSPEAARVALLDAFERMDVDKMAELSGMAFVATRMLAEAGAEA